jgi:hypothetical protein
MFQENLTLVSSSVSRSSRLHQSIGARSGAMGHRQHNLARLHRHQDGHGDSEGRARRKFSLRSRSAAWESRRRSRASSSTSARMRQSSSPAPTSPSTAVSICSDEAQKYPVQEVPDENRHLEFRRDAQDDGGRGREAVDPVSEVAHTLPRTRPHWSVAC